MDRLAEVTMLEREKREKLRLHNIILGKINLQFTLAYPAIAVNGILGLSHMRRYVMPSFMILSQT